jgi:hypothetical protein
VFILVLQHKKWHAFGSFAMFEHVTLNLKTLWQWRKARRRTGIAMSKKLSMALGPHLSSIPSSDRAFGDDAHGSEGDCGDARPTHPTGSSPAIHPPPPHHQLIHPTPPLPVLKTGAPSHPGSSFQIALFAISTLPLFQVPCPFLLRSNPGPTST